MSVFLRCVYFVRSVHLDARPKHARNAIQPLSGIYDFVRSVQLVARMNNVRSVFISCVACILMHE
ncbi:hypothetical protein HMPREF9065_01977 [Aggregatibacter sp. oral taxon 458 str. W10330]|nr:hypothetical protein HMPREF9065_01977 [Aggregatibacter sp. oral taxon 458 str. W10330]